MRLHFTDSLLKVFTPLHCFSDMSVMVLPAAVMIHAHRQTTGQSTGLRKAILQQ